MRVRVTIHTRCRVRVCRYLPNSGNDYLREHFCEAKSTLPALSLVGLVCVCVCMRCEHVFF
jgi:hypothetical protein